MLLFGALALGLIETTTTSPNLSGTNLNRMLDNSAGNRLHYADVVAAAVPAATTAIGGGGGGGGSHGHATSGGVAGSNLVERARLEQRYFNGKLAMKSAAIDDGGGGVESDDDDDDDENTVIGAGPMPSIAAAATPGVIKGGGGGGAGGGGGVGVLNTATDNSNGPHHVRRITAVSTVSGSGNGGTISWDNNATIRSLNPGDWSLDKCLVWQSPFHLYYQLGNAFFFMAFLAPHKPFGMLWLRALLVIGSILLAMYGYLIDCKPDVALWSALFLIINFVYLIVIVCRLRPVRFDKEIESVYITLFKPLRVSRQQFKKILSCMKLIRSLKYQEVYAQEKVTKVDSLSLVLSGKLVVSQNQRALHIVFPHQFLDSPEWFGVSTDDYFQVSIMAMEESRVLIWHRDKLKLSIMAEPFLQSVFDHILGRDVVKKLMQVTQVSESIASNGFLPSGGYDDAEDKPMLVMKKSIEGHGLTALINRQLQALPRISRYYECAGDPNSWRLCRIDETDHETAV